MSTSVSVLAPNGRRQTVKCTPNTTILEILEQVCKKQGFEPEDYDIKHHNKVLDTTSTFRFSGLPNNAQLELATASKIRVDSEVTLAVNLEDGSRVIGNFLPDSTLSDILNTLCPDHARPEQNPVIIYTRQEIYGESLQTTTLKSLGLRSGRAMVRLMHKSPDELKVQANISAPLPSKPVEEKPYHRTLKTDTYESAGPSNENIALDEPKPRPVQYRTNLDILKQAREKRKLPESPAKSSDSDIQQPKSKLKLETAQKVEEMEVDNSEESSIEPRLEEKSTPLPEYNFVYLGPRNAMLFSLETAQSLPTDDLPDDFFELTLDDARKILREYKDKTSSMENGVLMTSEMRNLEESKKQLRQLNKYKKCTIRVQFPERIILQGTFSPADTVGDVIEFVREYLENKSADFYLYTTPPKEILSGKDRLLEKGFVPNALLHLNSSSEGVSFNLRSDVSDKFTTNSMASLAASQQRQKFTNKNITYDDNSEYDDLQDIDQPGPSKPPDTAYNRRVTNSSEKVPKWFKPLQ